MIRPQIEIEIETELTRALPRFLVDPASVR